jgi:fluoroquinolone resistance protein
METTTVGDLRITTPDLDPDELDLFEDELDDDLTEARVEGAAWPGLELAGARIDRSLLVGVDLTESVWRNLTLRGCRLENVDLSGATFAGATVERCEFVGCRMTGLHLAKTSLKDVVFTDCRLDYARLDEVRVTGPTAWVRCLLGNATLTGCRLPTAALSECRLTDLELVGCDLRGTDLRDSDLTGVRGLDSLRGATIDTAQLEDVAVVAARELGLDVR